MWAMQHSMHYDSNIRNITIVGIERVSDEFAKLLEATLTFIMPARSSSVRLSVRMTSVRTGRIFKKLNI